MLIRAILLIGPHSAVPSRGLCHNAPSSPGRWGDHALVPRVVPYHLPIAPRTALRVAVAFIDYLALALALYAWYAPAKMESDFDTALRLLERAIDSVIYGCYSVAA